MMYFKPSSVFSPVTKRSIAYDQIKQVGIHMAFHAIEFIRIDVASFIEEMYVYALNLL